MLADPSCPHCAADLDALSGEIASERRYVRLALALFLSPSAHDLAAEVMLAVDQAEAAWRMLLMSARGSRLQSREGTS